MTSRIESIKARLAAATPGPWGHHPLGGGGGLLQRHQRGDTIIIEMNDADATLCAHAPQDLRLLLELAEAVRKVFIPAYLIAFGPDGTLKFHIDEKDLRTLWDMFGQLDSPVGDEGAE